MTARTSVTDERLARLIQVGFVLEAIVEERSDRHRHALARDRPGADLVRHLLAEAHEESTCHREQLASLLGALGADAPSAETLSTLAETDSGSVPASTEAALYDQLWSELAAYRFYDAVHERLVVAESLDLSVPPPAVAAVVEELRLEERQGVYEVMAALDSLDVQPAPQLFQHLESSRSPLSQLY